MAENQKSIQFYEMWKGDVPYMATTHVFKTSFAESLGMVHRETEQGSTYWFMEKPKTEAAFTNFSNALHSKTGRRMAIKDFQMKYLEKFPGWKEPSEYYFKIRPNEEAKLIAEDLIPKFHKHLSGAEIGYYYQKKPIDEDETMTGDVVAYVKRAPAHIRHFTGLDFMIFFYDGYWEAMSRYQRRAVVDHELEHCWIDDGTWTIRDHDLIEFRSIITRHPKFNASFALLIEQVREGELTAVDAPVEKIKIHRKKRPQ